MARLKASRILDKLLACIELRSVKLKLSIVPSMKDLPKIVPKCLYVDHISPRGMGGAWRDDHPDNIQAVHWWCNGDKGSSRY